MGLNLAGSNEPDKRALACMSFASKANWPLTVDKANRDPSHRQAGHCGSIQTGLAQATSPSVCTTRT